MLIEKLHEMIDKNRNVKENITTFVVGTVPADGLAPQW